MIRTCDPTGGKTTLSLPDIEMVALDYFKRPGHDNHRRLCRLSRNSNLARAPARYKIDTARLKIDVRTELSKKKKQGKGPANRQNTGKTAKRA